MLKITQASCTNRSVTFKLEGRLVGPWVDELRRVSEPILRESRTLNLDLAEVAFADTDGVAALAGLKSRGVTWANCSPFVAEQLKSLVAN